MLEFFRRHIKTIGLPLFALLALGFFFTGAGEYLGAFDNQTILARGNGFKITDVELSAQLRRVVEQQPDLDPKLFDTLPMRRAILEQLINDKVLALAAQQFRVHIGANRQLSDLLHAPRWARLRTPDGHLDQDAFEALARSQGLSVEALLQRLAADLAVQDVYQSVSESSFVSRGVIRGALDAFAQRREIQTMSFPAQNYLADVQVSTTAEKAYYEKHTQNYQSPERVDIEYLDLSLNAVKNTINPSVEEVREYYEKNAQGWRGQEERKASHILIASEANTAGREAARKQAEDLLQRLHKNPQSFEQLVKAYSQDPGSASAGGDLGYFSRCVMPAPFEDAVFALKQGALSDVVETDFGYHIIRLDDIKQEPVKAFSELRLQIKEDLRHHKASQLFAEKADRFNILVYEQSDSLEPAAKALGQAVKTAQNVSPAGPDTPDANPILNNPRFLQAVFANAKTDLQRNTAVIDLDDQSLAAARVLRYEPAKTLPFDTVRVQVQAAVRLKEALARMQKDGQVALLRAQENPQDVSLSWSETITVSRVQAASISAPLLRKALSIPTQQLPAVGGIDLGQQGYWLIKVVKVLPAKLDAQQGFAFGNGYQKAWKMIQEQAYLAWLRDHFQVEVFLGNN